MPILRFPSLRQHLLYHSHGNACLYIQIRARHNMDCHARRRVEGDRFLAKRSKIFAAKSEVISYRRVSLTDFAVSPWLQLIACVKRRISDCDSSSRTNMSPPLKKSVFSFLRQLTTWHCPHLLLSAVLWRGCCWPPTVQQSTDIICPRRAHSSKPAAAACGGRTIGRTDRQMLNIVIDPAAHANYGQCQ